MSERIRKFLTLPLLLLASSAWAQEPELLADVPSAEAAGFQIIDMGARPSEEYSDLVRRLVADYARSHGVDRPVRSSWAPITLPSGQILLAVWPLGAEFDSPDPRGGHLLVYAVQGRVTELVKEVPAMAVGMNARGDLATIYETGFGVFRWSGNTLQEMP
ncbi:hypothetical protein HPT29_027710 (plasmid) [Microvirga terrae]|uniref:Uncharacterized protein n=1 Tax=Microvirga terrae TaxID=2740529 RepID=A0ABY5S0M2_9HYPH|nr:hypothetical protein [Microvirga terrae]UVF22808.1 hypothetical protein HPT29_027710 [Microvirga terrae]